MFPVGLNDFLFYVVVSSVLSLGHPLGVLGRLRSLWIILVVLYKTLVRRVTPFPYRSPFSQQTTTKGYVLVAYLGRALRARIDPFNYRAVGMLVWSRNRRYMAHGLGDIEVEDRMLLRAFRSKSRADPPDLVVFFFHGGPGLGDKKGELYTEFLLLLVVRLLEQGFLNPHILVPDYSKTLLLPELVLAGCECHVVVASDLLGSSFAFRQADEMAANWKRKPAAMVLISPVVDTKGTALTLDDDYIDHETLGRWKRRVGPNFTATTRADPAFGWYVTFGCEEFLAPGIDAFVSGLPGRVKVDRQQAQVHNWPLVCLWSESTIYDREVSVESLAVQLSRMLVWNSQSYFAAGAVQPRVPPRLDEEEL